MASANITRRAALRTLASGMIAGGLAAGAVHACTPTEADAAPDHYPEAVKMAWPDLTADDRDWFRRLMALPDDRRGAITEYLIATYG